MPIIEVNNLRKEYNVKVRHEGLNGAIKGLFTNERKIIKAVNGISFSIDEGEVVGYIGPNGSGKSTTIKMMSGILVPSSGNIKIDGLDPQKERKQVVQNLGVVFGQRTQLYWDLRLGESFELLKRIYRIPENIYKQNLDIMKEILNVDEIIDVPVRQMSLGQRMKGDLTAAVLHSPKVLFLDEPTIGLDVDAKHSIRKFIKDINKINKTTIILTTHDLDDISELCSRVIILNKGEIIEDGSLKDLTDKVAPQRRLIIEFFEEPANVESLIQDVTDFAKITKKENSRIQFEFNRNFITASDLIYKIGESHKIRDLQLEEADIEDIIRQIYHKT